MAAEDWLDGQDPYWNEDTRPIPKTCKFCGKGNLEWEDDNGRWVLIDSNSGLIHRCISTRKVDIDKLLNGKI